MTTNKANYQTTDRRQYHAEIEREADIHIFLRQTFPCDPTSYRRGISYYSVFRVISVWHRAGAVLLREAARANRFDRAVAYLPDIYERNPAAL